MTVKERIQEYLNYKRGFSYISRERTWLGKWCLHESKEYYRR